MLSFMDNYAIKMDKAEKKARGIIKGMSESDR